MTAPRNASESVRQRLLNRSRSERRPFNELLQYFAMERFLYRLSQSAHAQRFVLKGALMLRVWGSPEFRQDHVPASFGEIMASVSRFLWPIVAALSSEKPSPTAWIAPGPWT